MWQWRNLLPHIERKARVSIERNIRQWKCFAQCDQLPGLWERWWKRKTAKFFKTFPRIRRSVISIKSNFIDIFPIARHRNETGTGRARGRIRVCCPSYSIICWMLVLSTFQFNIDNTPIIRTSHFLPILLSSSWRHDRWILPDESRVKSEITRQQEKENQQGGK